VLCEQLAEKWVTELKREFETFQKEQWKAKEKTTYKKFDKLIMNTQIAVHSTSTSVLLTYKMYRQKIVICLFERHITENDKQ